MSALRYFAPVLLVIAIGMTALLVAAGSVRHETTVVELATVYDSPSSRITEGRVPGEVRADEGFEDGAAIASALQGFGVDIDQWQAQALMRGETWAERTTAAVDGVLDGRGHAAADATMAGMEGVMDCVSSGGLAIVRLESPVVVYAVDAGTVYLFDPSRGIMAEESEAEFEADMIGFGCEIVIMG